MPQVVTETMVTLGMSAHTDRMLRLMVDSGVTNTAVLERARGLQNGGQGGLQQEIKHLYSHSQPVIGSIFKIQLRPEKTDQVAFFFLPHEGPRPCCGPLQPYGNTGYLEFAKPGIGGKRGLTWERCMELNLPWVLIESAQKRWTSEKMNLGPLGVKGDVWVFGCLGWAERGIYVLFFGWWG